MTREQVLARIQEILRDVVEDDYLVIGEATIAADVVDWDSANHVRLIIALEEELGFRLESDEIAEPESVGALIDLILSKLTH